MAQRQLSVHPKGLPAGPKTHTDPVQVNKKLVPSRLHPIKKSYKTEENNVLLP
jgi:hypothetical protein